LLVLGTIEIAGAEVFGALMAGGAVRVGIFGVIIAADGAGCASG
jgi:hypothetical protein